jgi:excisionase family DNA binding protein
VALPDVHASARSGHELQLTLPTGSLTRRDVLTARDVAEFLRLPVSTVYDLARRGVLPAHRVGRAWRFLQQEIEEWLLAS